MKTDNKNNKNFTIYARGTILTGYFVNKAPKFYELIYDHGIHIGIKRVRINPINKNKPQYPLQYIGPIRQAFKMYDKQDNIFFMFGTMKLYEYANYN